MKRESNSQVDGGRWESPPSTRQSLLSRLRDLEDQSSWQDFFDTYWKLIYHAAIKAGCTPSEAEDVVQETVVTVCRTIKDFRYDPKRGKFRNWLLKTANWRIWDQRRRRARHPLHEPAPNDDRGTSLEERLPDALIAEVAEVWEQDWQRNLMDAAIQRIKRTVNPLHYQSFELYVLKEWPAKKVAETLDVSRAQVHLNKHRVGNLIKKEVKRLEREGL